MKTSGPCRECGGKELYIVEDAREVHVHDPNRTTSLTVVAHQASTGVATLFGEKKKLLEVGLSATICARCGLTNWYAKNLEHLETLTQQLGAGVRKVTHGAG